MEASESFCLRWNDFESSYTETFRDLRQDSKFSDVTLVTPDSGNKAVQAHRVILSACSNFFKHMLCKQSQVHDHPHPLLYLRGVSYTNLIKVLDFMYYGEVYVDQHEINSFLAVAEELQIKGLETQAAEWPKPRKTPAPRYRDPNKPVVKRVRKSTPAKLKLATHVEAKEVTIDEDISIVGEVSKKRKKQDYAKAQQYRGDGNLEGGDDDSMTGISEEDIENIQQLMARAGSRWICTGCERDFRDKSDCRRHVIAKHTNIRDQYLKNFFVEQTVQGISAGF